MKVVDSFLFYIWFSTSVGLAVQGLCQQGNLTNLLGTEMASRTPYPKVVTQTAGDMEGNTINLDLESSNMGEDLKCISKYLPGCTTKGIWWLFRHGTRVPDADLLEDMIVNGTKFRDAIVQNHESGRGKYSDSNLCKILRDQVYCIRVFFPLRSF